MPIMRTFRLGDGLFHLPAHTSSPPTWVCGRPTSLAECAAAESRIISTKDTYPPRAEQCAACYRIPTMPDEPKSDTSDKSDSRPIEIHMRMEGSSADAFAKLQRLLGRRADDPDANVRTVGRALSLFALLIDAQMAQGEVLVSTAPGCQLLPLQVRHQLPAPQLAADIVELNAARTARASTTHVAKPTEEEECMALLRQLLADHPTATREMLKENIDRLKARHQQRKDAALLGPLAEPPSGLTLNRAPDRARLQPDATLNLGSDLAMARTYLNVLRELGWTPCEASLGRWERYHPKLVAVPYADLPNTPCWTSTNNPPDEFKQGSPAAPYRVSLRAGAHYRDATFHALLRAPDGSVVDVTVKDVVPAGILAGILAQEIGEGSAWRYAPPRLSHPRNWDRFVHSWSYASVPVSQALVGEVFFEAEKLVAASAIHPADVLWRLCTGFGEEPKS